MVKLIEEDADSFAKKAEMYYQKRPELLTLVDEFHRMYRSLAERYENITGELRKTSPLELQSQGSGFSDVSSSDITAELNRLSRPPSRRAPGFDYFLGTGGGLPSDVYHNKDGDDSASVTDHGFCLNAKVLSGRHEDRIHVLYFSSHLKSGEYNPATREFCSKFFSPEEMKNGMSIDSLVGRTFEAKCKVKVSNGKRFQNFGGFRVQTSESW